ncbi:death-on-curing family protein [Humibacillus xanthopallidus]|uniref:Death-on-curing family protein n=1 Tax=Humibacillus xanthopallidus TaxID=412689 RepID=A0A543PNC3_9MICO|nr:Fic family protein [Humibacillus xanthopallidus]TQN45582.1 death-on-curing family protein [Humibacillus xanthopallidus]
MPPRALTVRALAKEAGLDLDEALVTIWDAGVEAVDDIDSFVPRHSIPTVRQALGLHSAKQLQQLSFWEQEWGLTRRELISKLGSDFGILVAPGARVLPKGALKQLRRMVPASQLAVGNTRAAAPIAAPIIPLEWETPGRRRDVVALSVEEICQVHEALVRDFAASGDPIDPPGVREDHLLRSAAARPETSLGDVRKYDTVESYAAALLHSLVHNHPFHNGNKRTALVSMLVLLDRNNILLTCVEKDLFRQVLRVAQHRLVPVGSTERNDREVLAIAAWICANSRPIQRGDRLLKFKELRRILVNLGCRIGPSLPGNKIKFERDVEERVLGFRRTRTLRVTAGHRNEGSDVEPSQLSYIRRELRLDDKNGYDAGYFYGSDPREPDEFIGQYRTLLRRLGRL